MVVPVVAVHSAAACIPFKSQLLNSALSRSYYGIAIIMGSSQLPIIVYVIGERWLALVL
jgi:hypothetical protein